MNIPVEILWGVAAFLAAKIFEGVWSSLKKHQELKDETVKNLQVELKTNTAAMHELNFAVKNLGEKIAPLPKMEKDIDAAHYKIRELSEKINTV